MKQKYFFLFFLLLICSTSLFSMTGDVNDDDVIDIIDALLISQYYVGNNPEPFYPGWADVNCDSSIDILDSLLISQYYVGLITEFPCIKSHVLKFYIYSDLVGDLTQTELESRLSQYADEINFIFSKQTVRRFSFDPGTGIIIVNENPVSNAGGGLPESDYEIWIVPELTDNPSVGSSGGNAVADISGAGVVNMIKWDTIHDPSTLIDGSEELRQYWKQIYTIAHEIEHIFGAGIGEYYRMITVNDTTGIEPIVNIDAYNQDGPFWNEHLDYYTDPLLWNIWNEPLVGSPTSLADLRDTTLFADVTVIMVNRGARNYETRILNLPDLSTVTIKVQDQSTGLPIDNAIINAWSVDCQNPPYTAETILVENGILPGEYTSTWPPYPSPIVIAFSSAMMKLYKVSAAGYETQAKWVSKFDCIEEKMINGNNEMVIEINMVPIQ